MKVKVYSTPTCPYCKRTKAFLDENQIEYEDVNVSEDQDAVQEMIDKSGQMGVPVILIDDNVVVGFNKDRLSELLGI